MSGLFPVPGTKIKCGLRTDLPEKQRRHAWLPLGQDVRNYDADGFQECIIFACFRCGTDRKVSLDEIEQIMRRAAAKAR